MKCPECKATMKKVKDVNKIFMDKYIISDTTMYVCGKCGEEYIEDKEYERIRKKIASIESKAKIPAVHQVLAKVRFLIL